MTKVNRANETPNSNLDDLMDEKGLGTANLIGQRRDFKGGCGFVAVGILGGEEYLVILAIA
jgi:hypothetical protein